LATANNTEAVKASKERMLAGGLRNTLANEFLRGVDGGGEEEARFASEAQVGDGVNKTGVPWTCMRHPPTCMLLSVHAQLNCIATPARPAHLKSKKRRLRCARAAGEGSVRREAVPVLDRASTRI